MGKYNYKRDVFKGLNPFPFLGEVKTRISNIEAAPATVPSSVFNPNTLAARLHPSVQFSTVSEVVDHGDAKSFTLVPDASMGTEEMAFFRAGQYIALALEVDGKPTTRAYTIASSPKAALGKDNTSYTLTIKKKDGGFASDMILNEWKQGTKVISSGPLGNFYYQEMRDAKNVVALAGGSGITPFLSMAEAIADGIEDFNLTILYGSRKAGSILLKDKLDAVAAKSNGRVKVAYILSEDEAEGFEHGFISADIISKYAPAEDYSVFVCGPKAMYKFVKPEIAKLGLKERRVRFELSGEYGDPAQDPAFPQDAMDKQFNVTVLIRGEKTSLTCSSRRSLLSAMEGAGISVPSDCRSGECGWCHSRLISGDVFVPAEADGRKLADKKFGWIHPCSSYPLSDVELEVFPLMK